MGKKDADTDNSGSVSVTELGVIMANTANEMNAPAPTQEIVEMVMNSLDTDNDGTLNFQEFGTFSKILIENQIDDLQNQLQE